MAVTPSSASLVREDCDLSDSHYSRFRGRFKPVQEGVELPGIEGGTGPKSLRFPHVVVHRHGVARLNPPGQEGGLIHIHVAAAAINRYAHYINAAVPKRPETGVIFAIGDDPDSHASGIDQKA